MAKYRKKPVEIDAVKFEGFSAPNNFNERPQWLLDAIYKTGTIKFFMRPEKLFINTLEGTMEATEGDYIIRGIDGEIYPCKPDIFKRTYDKV